MDCGLSDAEQAKYAKYYATSEVAELWESLDAYSATAMTWKDVKKAISGLYPELTAGERYTRAEFDRLVETWQSKGIKDREDFGDFKREFLVRSKYLIKNGYLTDPESDRAFMKAISGEFRERLIRRLEIKDPDHRPGTPYPVAKVIEHGDFVLGGIAAESPAVPSSSAPSAVKKEEVNLGSVWDTLKSLQVQLDTLGRAGSVPRSAPPPGQVQNRAPGCAFCGELSHYIRSCPKVLEYISAGKCARNAEGKVTLPNGSFIPGSAPGRTMMERIDFVQQQNQPVRSVNLIEVAPMNVHAPATSSPAPATVFYAEEAESPSEDYEVERLEVMLNEAKKRHTATARKAKYDNDKAPKSSTAKATPSQSAPAPAPKPSAPNPSTPAAPTKSQPQYRYQAPIEDPGIVQTVLTRALDSTITISNRELFALAPDVRRQIKELTQTKKYAIGETHFVGTDSGTESGTDSGTEVYATSSELGGSVFYSADKPTAEESLPLRTVKALVADTIQVEAILDQGAVVCIIREDVWERLGIHMRRDQAIVLESADTGKSTTLGMIENAKFTIGGVDVMLQVQVVRHAPFEALLGRPFFAITECETKDFLSGDQHLTLTDPANRDRKCTVATGVRFAKDQGFQQSRN